MGRGSRRLRRQADAAGQSIDQLIHIIALAVGQQQFSGLAILLLRGIPDNNGVFVRVLPGSVRLWRRVLRGRLGHGAGRGCSLSAPGAHGVVGAHELLRAVRRDSVQTADLHRKAAWDRLAAGHLDGFTHRLSAALRHRLRRRSGLGLFAGGELDRIALFAVDRAGHAAGQRIGRVLLGLIDRAADKVHRLAALLLRATAGRAGIFAAPDLLRRVLVLVLRLGRAYRLGGRGGAGRLLRPLLGDHQLLGFLLRGEKTAQKALFSARLCAALGRLLRLLIGIILLQHGRVILILRIFTAERDIDGHKRPRILGMLEAEKAALFLFRLRHPALFIGHDRDRVLEELLELVFALIQGIGVRSAAVRRHFKKKILDDAGAGRIAVIAQTAGRVFRSCRGRHRLLRRPGTLHGLRRLTRGRVGGWLCRARRAGGGLHGRSGLLQQGVQPAIRTRGRAAVGHRLCGRGGDADTAQDLIDLTVGDTVPQTGLRLLYIQVFQNTVNRIIGTFAWHGDSSL